MTKTLDMEVFLSGVLTGSHSTRERHLRQAKDIQKAITERWARGNPWTWQQKHLNWILKHHLSKRAESTRYYYFLTIYLIADRLGKDWNFEHKIANT